MRNRAAFKGITVSMKLSASLHSGRVLYFKGRGAVAPLYFLKLMSMGYLPMLTSLACS